MRIDLTAGAKRRTTSNWISGVFLQRTRSTDASLGMDLQMADTRGIWLASYNLVSGRAKGLDRDRYRLGRGSIRRFQNLSDDWSLRGGVSFQHARDKLLPSGEQMLIGGEYSVRGYPVG
ncbi:ShlB/FhaC/HecB family hemolysin secretion/activation protein, partial [Arthrospira platensis SPKY1]|nr:ShlB/FhaC/HecB family hemolysin secretion/activation protein [Arthrospira platensis SPKY1]